MSLSTGQQKLVDLVTERAEQACRYALKSQNFDSGTDAEFKSGFEVAVSVCSEALRRQITAHIEDDIRREGLADPYLIVEKLAQMSEPLHDSGFGDSECGLCNANRPYDEHDADCPWLMAQAKAPKP